MQETFERVTERHGGKAVPIKHFYRRQYQMANGEWSTLYYARLKIGWKPRAFPVGTDLKAVHNGLKIYKARNIRREDFDMGKIKPESGMTVAAWADSRSREVKAKRSIDRDRTWRHPLSGRWDRRELLTEALPKIDYPVIQSIPFNVNPAELIRAAKELELEA